jgi:methylisocitrate lyase
MQSPNMNGTGPRRTLRGVLAEKDLVIAPGVWDGFSAAIAESVGFDAYLSPGWATAATMGLPDADIYTRTQNATSVRYISAVTNAAILADIDGGYGNAIGVMYTVQEFEDAGASAMLLEDQESPKRCNHMVASLELEDIETAAGKIRAAVDARQSPETMIVARTDAVGDEIYRRAEAYAEAGAEMICPIAPSPEFDADCWRQLHERTGLPLMSAFVPGTWQEREFTPEVMGQIGVKLACLGLHHLYAAATGLLASFERIKAGEPPAQVFEGQMTQDDFARIIGLERIFELERKYLGDAAHQRVATGSIA